MDASTAMLWLVVAVSVLLIAALLAWPGIVANRGGKLLAFVVFLVFPVVVSYLGLEEHLERSKQTQFCLSCHVMEPYGKSLYIDDMNHIPAAHFQNHRVPADEACFTCHTDYVLYGQWFAKLRGLRHIYVQYFGKPENPIHLYTPFNNRECLHCHEGARKFVESALHPADSDAISSIRANEVSCVSSGCHDSVHDVAHLKEQKLWQPPK